jgi:hypothetical protein
LGEGEICDCELAEISFEGEENLLVGWSAVNSKILVQLERQMPTFPHFAHRKCRSSPRIYADRADQSRSKAATDFHGFHR